MVSFTLLDAARGRKFPGAGQYFFQFRFRPVDAAFDRSLRGAQHPGGLLIGDAFQLGQHQGLALVLRQAGDGFPQAAVLICRDGLILRAGGGIRRIRQQEAAMR